MQSVTKWYIQLGEWGFNLFFLNLMWFIFSIMGALVLGLFPSTVALFAVIRKLSLENDSDINIFKLFWHYFRNDFIRSNVIGYCITLIGLFLYLDLRLVLQFKNSFINQLIVISLIIFIILYIITIFNLFPLYVHYNLKTLEYFKSAFILTIARPLQSLLVSFSLVIVYMLFRFIPGLIPAFGMSLTCLIIYKVASLSFQKIKP